MIIKWAKSDQHTDFGLFKVGDVIDATARGIPDGVISSWARDGFAIEMKPGVKAESRREAKKITIGGQHG